MRVAAGTLSLGFENLSSYGERAMSLDQKQSEPRLAYIRAIKSEAAASLHPAIPRLALGQHVFELHADDGTLIAVADTREAALEGAAKFKLEALSLH